MHVPEGELKTFLVKEGYLTAEEFDQVAADARSRHTEVTYTLVQRGLFSEELLAKALGKYLNIPFVDLRGRKIDLGILATLSEDVARKKKAVVFDKNDEGYHVAMTDPDDLETIQFLDSKLDGKIKMYITSDESLRSALIRYKTTMALEFKKIMERAAKDVEKLEGDPNEIARDLPVVQIFDAILSYGVTERTSDIHIEPLKTETLIRFRVDGALKEIIRFPKSTHDAIIARIKILSNLRVDEHQSPQDGRFKVHMQDVGVSLRVSVIPTFHGEKVVMRVLIEETRYFSLESLGMSKEQADRLKIHIGKPHGMILSTGPTGSGKTTTLYTVLRIRNTSEVNITTIEDPIEYDVEGINQIQVNAAAELTFASGLRSVLRQSPDIIMVGEIRDKETASLSINAALTGHLLFSTLHTNDAPGAVPRMIDLGVEPFLLASTLDMVMGQRLIRKICIDCIENVKLTDAEVSALRERIENSASWLKDKIPKEAYRGKGCEICGHSGYRGQIAVFEFFEISEKIRQLINKKSTIGDLREEAHHEGMRTMLEDGLDKVQAGITTVQEVLRALED